MRAIAAEEAEGGEDPNRDGAGREPATAREIEAEEIQSMERVDAGGQAKPHRDGGRRRALFIMMMASPSCSLVTTMETRDTESSGCGCGQRRSKPTFREPEHDGGRSNTWLVAVLKDYMT